MEEPTPEARDLAERVLKALREWHPGILEPTWCRAPRPNSEQDLERGFLARFDTAGGAGFVPIGERTRPDIIAFELRDLADRQAASDDRASAERPRR